MDHGVPAASATVSFRPRSSFALVGGGWVLVAGIEAAHWSQSGAVGGLRGLPLAAAAAYLVWLTLWQPRVEVSDDGVLVVNPFRDVRVPWAALVNVSTQYALTLVTPHGSYRAWAAPGPGRHQAVTASGTDLTGLPTSTFDARGAVQLGDLPNAGSGAAGELVRRRWQDLVESERLDAGVADETAVDVRWHGAQIATLVALTVVGVALLTL